MVDENPEDELQSEHRDPFSFVAPAELKAHRVKHRGDITDLTWMRRRQLEWIKFFNWSFPDVDTIEDDPDIFMGLTIRSRKIGRGKRSVRTVHGRVPFIIANRRIRIVAFTLLFLGILFPTGIVIMIVNATLL